LTAHPDTLLDETDRKILQILQDNFPLVERPYQHVAQQLNLTETHVIERLNRLNQQGVTQKIGAVINTSKTGLNAATLVGLKVPPNRVNMVADIINQYAEVSHNYERDHEYNVWFTLKTKNRSELTATLSEIVKKTALNKTDVISLPTKNCFKINVRFNLL
jgi:DNA-binding Lrp family transcriptional regulator